MIDEDIMNWAILKNERHIVHWLEKHIIPTQNQIYAEGLKLRNTLIDEEKLEQRLHDIMNIEV